ncbi:MAG: RlmE family RNA methyltransferase [Rickettsiales bacterium]|jgi:23S rRNA (uridine2552-2'-O)-methyltransferase|nr:RlmE family RNA methyltransferase [Rickettsiales bacterium]
MRGTSTKKENVKTAKGRKKSSTLWLKRQLNDEFAKKAKDEGLRCRACYKIQEIQDKYKFFTKGKKVIDLGAAPGGWSQVVIPLVGKNNVVGIDLLDIEPIDGLIFKQGDFNDIEIQKWLSNQFGKTDIIMSDMAPNTTGIKSVDHLRIMGLLEEVFAFAKENLKEGGILIAKVFRGGAENELLAEMKKSFKKVEHFKPKSSRSDSVEIFIIAQGFKI